jgi:hypothetical protein
MGLRKAKNPEFPLLPSFRNNPRQENGPGNQKVTWEIILLIIVIISPMHTSVIYIKLNQLYI